MGVFKSMVCIIKNTDIRFHCWNDILMTSNSTTRADMKNDLTTPLRSGL